MAEDYRLSPASTLADVSDRTARLLGLIGLAGVNGFGDGSAALTNFLSDNGGSLRPIGALPVAMNAAGLTDRVRNLQAGAHKFGLGVGLPTHSSAWGTLYFGVGDPARVVSAVNQFNVYRLRNPAASGKTIIVHAVRARWSAARRFVIVQTTTSSVDRTTNLPPKAKVSAIGAVVGVLTLDTNVAANLTNLIHAEVLVANTPVDYVQPIRIAAGDMVDFGVGDIGGAAGELGDFNVEWSEEA